MIKFRFRYLLNLYVGQFFSAENLLSVDYTDKFNSEFSGVGSKLKRERAL